MSPTLFLQLIPRVYSDELKQRTSPRPTPYFAASDGIATELTFSTSPSPSSAPFNATTNGAPADPFSPTPTPLAVRTTASLPKVTPVPVIAKVSHPTTVKPFPAPTTVKVTSPAIVKVSCHGSVECGDMLYGRASLSNKVKNPLIQPILNEKALFRDMVQYSTDASPSQQCASAECHSSFCLSSLAIHHYFTANQPSLFVPCQRYDRYSLCQEYYLFQFNASSSTCQRFVRQPCRPHRLLSSIYIRGGLYRGVTLTFQLS